MLSVLLLLMFPLIILGTIWIFLALVNYLGTYYYDAHGNMVNQLDVEVVNGYFLSTIPWVILGVGVVPHCLFCQHLHDPAGHGSSLPVASGESPSL